MLPYFRSMEAFFNLSLPTDWQSLSDSQFQYFFTQLSHDLPMEEILTLCRFKWADLRVLCKTHDGSYLVKHRQAPKHETTLTIRQVQATTASLDFLRQFAPIMIATLSTCAQLERDNISFRLQSGRKRFIEKGGKLGRKVGSVKTAEQIRTEYRDVISLLRRRYSIRDVAKLSGKGVSTIQRVKRLIKVQSSQ